MHQALSKQTGERLETTPAATGARADPGEVREKFAEPYVCTNPCGSLMAANDPDREPAVRMVCTVATVGA